ncbi:MAG: hypothetical protein ABIJ21_09260 [Nanoarchaeota archaeon]
MNLLKIIIWIIVSIIGIIATAIIVIIALPLAIVLFLIFFILAILGRVHIKRFRPKKSADGRKHIKAKEIK